MEAVAASWHLLRGIERLLVVVSVGWHVGWLRRHRQHLRTVTYGILLLKQDASCFLWAPGAAGLLSCSPRVAVRPGGEFIVGLPGLTAEWGALGPTPPWLWVFVYAPRIRSVLSGWLVQSGLGRFPVAPEGFNAVLGQLARWFYPFVSGAHCNNYYFY